MRFAALILALLAMFGTPAFAQAPAGSPVAVHGALAVKNGKIVDVHGIPVTLRGMSLFWSQWQPQYYSKPTVDWLAKDWKVSLLRVAVAAEGNDGARQNYAREMKKARTVIDAAIANGIYVIVDWHAHHAYPEDAKRFLVEIAKRYGTTPNLIYEPWNEPLQDASWAETIKHYHQDVIAAIRAVDPDNIVVAGSRSWDQRVDEAAADPLAFANVAYSLHFYAGSHKADLRARGDAAMKLGAALFVSEYGSVNYDGNGPVDIAETKAWWNWMEANGISYANWSVADKAESSAALVPGASAKGHWTDSEISPSGKLVRDHLRAMAGR